MRNGLLWYVSCTSGDTFHLNFFKLVQSQKQPSGIVERILGSLKLVRLQNHTKNQYFFVVWFWFGFGLVLVWFRSEPKPYQNHTKRICLRTYARTGNEYDGSICYFLHWILAEIEFRRNRCGTIHVPLNYYNGYLSHTIVK